MDVCGSHRAHLVQPQHKLFANPFGQRDLVQFKLGASHSASRQRNVEDQELHKLKVLRARERELLGATWSERLALDQIWKHPLRALSRV